MAVQNRASITALIRSLGPFEQPRLTCLQHLDVCPTAYWDGIWQQRLFPCPASNRAIRCLKKKKSDGSVRVPFFENGVQLNTVYHSDTDWGQEEKCAFSGSFDVLICLNDL